MNYGILHNRRPAKDTAANASNPLLSDVRMREMAKQMGLEPKDFGREAMELWKTLDTMAENDPTAYQSFIADQLKDGPPSEDSGDAMPKPLRAFNPKPGYVVKCAMMGPVKQQMVEIKLFLNLCFHEIIDLPRNPNSNKEVPRDSRAVPTTSNLQIPLVIGSLREIKDFTGAPCRAIDVVFHPWVRARSAWDFKFKRDIMSLAITWVQQDAKITLVSSVGKFIKSVYKGGVTVGSEIITARFPIEPEQQQTRTFDVKLHDDENQCDEEQAVADLTTKPPRRDPPVEKISMVSPSDLLKKLGTGNDDDTKSDFLIAPAGQRGTRNSNTPPPVPAPIEGVKKNLIEVIDPNSVVPAKPTPQQGGIAPVVKRGFLNSSKKPLYPKGSNEGKPASAYVNLLSRSKVVDLGTVEQEEKKKKEEASRRQKEVAALFDVKTPMQLGKNEVTSSIGDREVDHGDYEFERLCMEADPELAAGNATQLTAAADGVFGEHLDHFAKFLSLQS